MYSFSNSGGISNLYMGGIQYCGDVTRNSIAGFALKTRKIVRSQTPASSQLLVDRAFFEEHKNEAHRGREQLQHSA